ncbi:MAG: DUF459 domain-containing protein [Actinobacteria bacterium]|nr:DUF459 domain-containing protein [Actinomycetota bacterium]
MPTTTRPPNERHPAARIPRRRPLSAGHVVVVMLVCALVGGLLNAAGIRKTANGQPVGIRRDVARFFAEPLYDVSHALQIDRLRKGLQAVSGRSGDDDINTRLPDPVAIDDGDPTTSTTAPPKKQAFSPTDRMTLWIGGDSLAITPGQSFVNLAPGAEVIDVVGNSVNGQVATGLARPEVFNWPQHLLEVIASDDPDAVVITLGSNDDQTMTGDGGVGPFGSPEWIAEYRRRVGGMMDVVSATGDRKMFWIGAPMMRNEERSETRYRIINDIYREEAAKRPGRVYYIDVYERFRDANGSYADIIDGVQVRTPDGIHFSREGGDQIAQVVLDTLDQAYDLTSWRVPAPGTTVPTTAPASAPTGAPTTPTTKAKRTG